jgi:PII-like signaling protein
VADREPTVDPPTPPDLEPAVRLTIWCRADDRGPHHRALVVEVLRRAKQVPVAGATVQEAQVGFGASRRIRHPGLWRDDAPLRIEVVDRQDRIDRFLALLEDLRPGLVLTVQEVQVTKGGLG